MGLVLNLAYSPRNGNTRGHDISICSSLSLEFNSTFAPNRFFAGRVSRRHALSLSTVFSNIMSSGQFNSQQETRQYPYSSVPATDETPACRYQYAPRRRVGKSLIGIEKLQGKLPIISYRPRIVQTPPTPCSACLGKFACHCSTPTIP